MISIDADHLDHKALNDRLRGIKAPVQLTNCCGQRFIAAGMAPVSLSITGVPGNALGAYLNGGKIVVHGNAQDAVGDTMNDGTIIVHGSIGDAAGYAMRGGKIYVKGNAGYRAGIHIKAYEDIAAIDERLTEFCTIFSYDKNVVMEEGFTKIVPSSSNPYKALYVTN